MINFIVLMLAVFFALPNLSLAEDQSFYRFWRGFKKEALSVQEFKTSLNEIFIPATGELSKTLAKLKSYQPVLLGSNLLDSVKLPIEYALVEYKNEQTYKEFRATEAGKRYSDLHWDYFSRENSKSLVAEPYKGTVEFEKAYDVIQKPVNWQEGHSRFRLFERKPDISNDEEYKQAVVEHISYLKEIPGLEISPRALFILVSEQYVVQYELWASEEDYKTAKLNTWNFVTPLRHIATDAMDIETVHTREAINYGEGLNYLVSE